MHCKSIGYPATHVVKKRYVSYQRGGRKHTQGRVTDGVLQAEDGTICEIDVTIANTESKSYRNVVARKGPTAILNLKEQAKITKHREAVEQDGRCFIPIVLTQFGQLIDPDAEWLEQAAVRAHSVMPSLYPFPSVFKHALQTACYEICASRAHNIYSFRYKENCESWNTLIILIYIIIMHMPII